MSFKRYTVLSYLSVVVVALLGTSTPAQAASIVCPTNIGNSQPIWDNVTPNTGLTGCEIGGTNNDSVAQVNADTMFDLANWELLTGANVNAISGNLVWGAGVFAGHTINSLMVVLKDGEDAQPGNYVGYLIPVGTTQVAFITPFLNLANSQPKDTSHYNLYSSPTSRTVVPEPASLSLLGVGIGSLIAARRRRAKK